MGRQFEDVFAIFGTSKDRENMSHPEFRGGSFILKSSRSSVSFRYHPKTPEDHAVSIVPRKKTDF